MNIAPQPDALTQPFWDAVNAGYLVLQHCAHCQTFVHPPLQLCPVCRNGGLEWRSPDALGTVYSQTTVHHAALDVVKSEVPYSLLLVELDAGPRMVLNAINKMPDEIRIGMRGRVVIHTNEHGITLPQFEIASEAHHKGGHHGK